MSSERGMLLLFDFFFFSESIELLTALSVNLLLSLSSPKSPRSSSTLLSMHSSPPDPSSVGRSDLRQLEEEAITRLKSLKDLVVVSMFQKVTAKLQLDILRLLAAASNLQYNMSKEHSEQDTRLTPNKLSLEARRKSAAEETQRAVEYYSNLRKDYLQAAKKEYLQQIHLKKANGRGERESPEEIIEKKKKKKKKKDISKSRLDKDIQRPSRLRRVNYRQKSSSPDKLRKEDPIVSSEQGNSVQTPKRADESESDYHELGPFEIKPVHECILQMQKVVDNFLDYQWTHRKKRSIALQELLSFLKTTKYGLNCRRYLDYLRKYNARLYQWCDQRLICQQLSGQKIECRCEQTKRRMTHKEISELLI